MKKSLPLILLLALMLSCKDKSPGSSLELCGVKDPVNNLNWLKALVDEAKTKDPSYTTIVAVTVKGETLINYYVSIMSCIGCISYHCDGTRFDMSVLSQEESKQYQEDIWGEKGRRVVLWPQK
ncbi:hypothetical protein [Dyadobacter sp. CY323]|uniref:hypothetical protein n=1 Tax=Dyadobacter sp. CY323 TaxID=2907302 RepID=UPI001F390E60|nr:hypothetical protein [Dyadobacter sp. CY323]MCE6991727.1 hypothetical protein [Dyadobacter sp. CY323]